VCVCVCVCVHTLICVCGYGCKVAGLPACSFAYLACNAPPYYELRPLCLHCNFDVFHKRHDFRKKITEHKMCILVISTTLSQIFLVLRRVQRDTVINVKTSSCAVLVILVGF
jgi:hypothetical protein